MHVSPCPIFASARRRIQLRANADRDSVPSGMAKIRPPKIPVRPPDKVAMLTSALRTYMAQNDSHDVHVLAEIGRRLAEIRDELRHGQWNAWLDREVPFTSRSATNSIQVHHFQTAQP